jgi:DNA (cytosine-5)-methyltransferase 1
VADTLRHNVQRQQPGIIDQEEWARSIRRQVGSRGNGSGWWRAEPDVGRVANGVPDRAHRLKGLGNAVVPQIPELIGNAILESMAQQSACQA